MADLGAGMGMGGAWEPSTGSVGGMRGAEALLAQASLMDPDQIKAEEEREVRDTIEKRDRWRSDRQVHEQEWFINTAMFRGNHYVQWNDRWNRLEIPKAPPHRVRLKINRLQAKLRARLAKFVKNRPKPLVVPATDEYQDYLNAKATQKLLDYLWRKLKLEQKYKDALRWAMLAGKGFWWFHWNPSIKARVKVVDPLTGAMRYEDRPLGDIQVEVGSPFEVLVADPGLGSIGDQPEIMRVKMRKVEDLKQRYPQRADEIQATTKEESLFTYERQIAGLNPYSFTGSRKHEGQDETLVTEHFIKPNAEYPQGRYRVLAGDTLLKAEDGLPGGFEELENPFPVVEFTDIAIPGQFWSTTLCSQLVDMQREYNLMRSKLAESTRLMAFPKLLTAKQHQIPQAAWTSEPGERIDYVGVPNLPPPQAWSPQNVAADLWRHVEQLAKEFDDVTQIFPQSEGKAGGATSGFQTNLLQEATDSVHGPDIRSAELAVEEASWKMRRLAKLMYDVPRLISATGTAYQAEVFEFVNDQIDEMADVVVEVGSALPTLKAAKQEGVMNLYKLGMFGDPNDPMVKKAALGLLEMGSIEEGFDLVKTDENQARLENKELGEGQPIQPPHFWEHHQIHYMLHTNLLKSPEVRHWTPPQLRALMAHAALHARFINPQSALQMAMQEGLEEVIPVIQAMIQPPPMPPGPSGPSEEPGDSEDDGPDVRGSAPGGANPPASAPAQPPPAPAV